jgi:hypothetical protein
VTSQETLCRTSPMWRFPAAPRPVARGDYAEDEDEVLPQPTHPPPCVSEESGGEAEEEIASAPSRAPSSVSQRGRGLCAHTFQDEESQLDCAPPITVCDVGHWTVPPPARPAAAEVRPSAHRERHEQHEDTGERARETRSSSGKSSCPRAHNASTPACACVCARVFQALAAPAVPRK